MKKPLFPARRRMATAVSFTVALPIFAWDALAESVHGGLRGPLMLLLVPFLAIAAFLLAISAWRAFPASRRARIATLVLSLLALPVTIFSTVRGLREGRIFTVQALVPGKSSAPFNETRIIFRGGGQDFVIRDPSNRLQFRYGPQPASVEIHNDLRTVIFDQPVHLKSWNDSITFENDRILAGGWKGKGLDATAASGTSIMVGADGRIICWDGS